MKPSIATEKEYGQRIYRVDKFKVPESGRAEFIQKLNKTHELLNTLPGFLQDFVLEKTTGDSEFNIATLVEWENKEMMECAKPRVKAMHEKLNFNPQEMLERFGIKADLGNYKVIYTDI